MYFFKLTRFDKTTRATCKWLVELGIIPLVCKQTLGVKVVKDGPRLGHQYPGWALPPF